MPQNENAQASITETFKLVDSTVPIEQPRQEPSAAEGEKTPDGQLNTEKSYNSGAKKAREIGESRRKLAKALLDTASKSEIAAGTLKKQLESDPQISKYIRSNWPNEYNKIILGEVNSAPLDEQAIRVQAKAEVLAEQLKEDRESQLEDYAVNIGFQAEEMEQLEELAQDLEGKKIGGQKLDYLAAMQKAASIIRPDKARLSNIHMPEGTPHKIVEVQERETANESLALARKKMLGGDVDKIKSNLAFVDKHLKGNVFTMPLD